MEEKECPPPSVLEGHGKGPYTGSAWREKHCIWDHSYFILESDDPLNATAFAFKDSPALALKKQR